MFNKGICEKCGKLLISIVVFAYGGVSNANTKYFECAFKSRELSHHLELSESDGNLVDFDYIAVSLVDNGPPFPSCSINATTGGKKAKKTNWIGNASEFLVELNDSADSNDRVIIKKNQNRYIFDFSNVSPMNCGPSSGIAEKIVLRLNSKKCQVLRLRN